MQGWRFFVCALIADRALPPPIERAEDRATVVLDRNNLWLSAFTNSEDRWRFRADLEQIDPLFVDELIAIEDKRFRHHLGVDPLAVSRATISALTAGRVVSGASTLTMQTARLLEPRPRNLGAKGVEMLRALQLERRLSKDEILELYLTLAPYGGNLEGVEAASLAYFGHAPDALSPSERALLIALPQAPEARRPDRHPAAARRARARILARLAEQSEGDEATFDALDAPLPERRSFPSHASHVTRRLAAGEPGAKISATIDLGLQSELEKLTADAARRAGGAATVAAIAVENEIRAVRAYIGGARRNVPGGWIDMLRARRSPGSTLKPFVYGLAFDGGFAGAHTVLDDAPHRFAGYMPENFDKQFRGEIRLREALQHSLNVPAVHALDWVGPDRFAATLRAAGATVSAPGQAGDKPGLALALGGAGVSAEDLALLYAALGDQGRVRPLTYTATGERDAQTNDHTGQFLLSSSAADRIVSILQDSPAPAGRPPAALSANAPKIAFKTGTSYGFRDAWAAGVTRDWTVIVWVGRPDGAPRPGETGRKAALPLLFDIVDRLGTETRAAQPERQAAPSRALARLPARAPKGPEILFPPDGAVIPVSELGAQARGLTLAAKGRNIDWYADGAPLPRSPIDQKTVWRPEAPGFYTLRAVSSEGAQAVARVRVRTLSAETAQGGEPEERRSH